MPAVGAGVAEDRGDVGRQRERHVEAGQAQDLQHRARRSGDHELEAVHTGAAVLGDREAQARRIDELEAGEVEDDALAARLEPTEHLRQLGRGGEVELAREADDGRGSGMLDGDVELRSVVIAHVPSLRGSCAPPARDRPRRGCCRRLDRGAAGGTGRAKACIADDANRIRDPRSQPAPRSAPRPLRVCRDARPAPRSARRCGDATTGRAARQKRFPWRPRQRATERYADR